MNVMAPDASGAGNRGRLCDELKRFCSSWCLLETQVTLSRERKTAPAQPRAPPPKGLAAARDVFTAMVAGQIDPAKGIVIEP